MSDSRAMVETVVRGIREASLTMFIKSTDAANLITELTAENAKLKRAAERDADVMEALNLLLEESQAENAKLRDFIELLLSCPRDSGECDECRRLNDLCAVELEAGKLGIEVNA